MTDEQKKIQDLHYLRAIKRWKIHHLSIEAKRAPEVFERLMDSEEAGVWILAGFYHVDVKELDNEYP